MKTNLDIALLWFTAATIFSLPFFSFGMDYPTAFLESTSALTSVGITSLSKADPLYIYRAFLAFWGGVLFLITLPNLISTGDSFKFAIHDNISKKKMIITYVLLFCFGVFLYTVSGANLKDSLIFSALTISTTGAVMLPENLIIPADILMFLSIVFPLLYIVLNYRVSIISVIKRDQFKYFFAIFLFAVFYLLLNDIYVKYAVFYVLSFISTTGFYTEDFFSLNSKIIYLLYLLAILGGLIGSIGGGVKIFRVIMLFKIFFAELKRTLYPRAVIVIKLNSSPTPQKIIGKVLIFFFLYTSGIFAFSLILSFFGITYEHAAATSLSLFATLGILPMEFNENLFNLSTFLKIIIAFVFIILRLKIFIFFIVVQYFYEKLIASGVHSWTKK